MTRFFRYACLLLGLTGSAFAQQPVGMTAKPLPSFTNNDTSLKDTKGQLAYALCWNPNATVAFIQTFDAAMAGAVTLGVTANKGFIPIPPTNISGYALALQGFQFNLGIQVAATTTST